MTDRPIRVVIMKERMAGIWRPVKGVVIKEASPGFNSSISVIGNVWREGALEFRQLFAYPHSYTNRVSNPKSPS